MDNLTQREYQNAGGSHGRYLLWVAAGRPETATVEPEPVPEPPPVDYRAETDRMYAETREIEHEIRKQMKGMSFQSHLDEKTRRSAISSHVSEEVRNRAGLVKGEGTAKTITYTNAQRLLAACRAILAEVTRGDWAAFSNTETLRRHANRAIKASSSRKAGVK